MIIDFTFNIIMIAKSSSSRIDQFYCYILLAIMIILFVKSIVIFSTLFQSKLNSPQGQELPQGLPRPRPMV